MEIPIRILIIGMHDKIGGVETFLMNYYRNIDRNKVQFDFISIYDKLCFEDEIKSLGGRVYTICSEKVNPIKYCKQLEKIIRENNYEIVHINMLSAANILPVIVAKEKKIKHIIIHSHNSNTPTGLLRKLLNALNKPFLHWGTDFFACSKLAGEWMFGKNFLKKHSLNIINNAVDIDNYKFAPEIRENVRRELKCKYKFIIGHIGRFCYQKNHDFLIDVFYEVQKEDKDAILLLIGEGELKEEIQEKVKKMNMQNSVIFLGTTNKVQNYLQAMDLFILPSRFEGLPVVGIEAQASGTKCLFSSNITEETKIAKNTEFLDMNVQEWKKAILNCKNISKEHENVIDNKYNIKVACKELEKIYIDMAEGIER